MGSRSTRFLRHFLTSVLILTASAPVSVRAEPEIGQLKVLRTQSKVTLTRTGKKVGLDLGVWVSAIGQDLRIRVRRPDPLGSFEVARLDPSTGEELQAWEERTVTGWNGLSDFSRVILRNDQGNVVRRIRSSFCPGASNRQRTGDGGPEVPVYPSCGAGSPFFRGAIWGLERDWASPLVGGTNRWGEPVVPRVDVKDGAYHATVRISPYYRDLLGLSNEASMVTVAVQVKTVKRSDGGHLHRTTIEEDDPEPQNQDATIPEVTEPDPETLPDLAALPAWGMVASNRRDDRSLLRFSTTLWNEGPSPLVVEGFRRNESDVMDAYQYFYSPEGEVVGKAPVGEFGYDARDGHDHWHFLQFARFSLLNEQEEVVRSRKQSFCIVPTDAIDLSVRGAVWDPYGLRRSSVCGAGSAIWLRQNLDPGWGDTYHQAVPGQAFNITHVPNGVYRVRVQVDPTGDLYQVGRGNDIEDRTIRLSGPPGARRVKVEPWRGLDI